MSEQAFQQETNMSGRALQSLDQAIREAVAQLREEREPVTFFRRAPFKGAGMVTVMFIVTPRDFADIDDEGE